MSEQKKPRGYIERALFVDVETSGLAFNSTNPVKDPATGDTFQIVSIGLVVTNAITLNAIEELYLEIKWNGVSKWEKRAEQVHGLSLSYLEQNGVSEEEAVCQIASLILKHWGPESPVCLGGHNVATFDKMFLMDLLERHEIFVRWGSKTIDTNAIGFATLGTHNSDELFAELGLERGEQHNALEDANHARKAVQIIRQLFQRCTGG